MGWILYTRSSCAKSSVEHPGLDYLAAMADTYLVKGEAFRGGFECAVSTAQKFLGLVQV